MDPLLLDYYLQSLLKLCGINIEDLSFVDPKTFDMDHLTSDESTRTMIGIC